MGIKGLLPFLSSIQREVNIASFSGKRAACDAYCWLHKGAYSCAMQLVMKTDKCDNLPFIRYCMKRVNLLRQHNIKPFVVFDGASLPMKAATEKERREKRVTYLQRGKALLQEGKKSEAVDCFQKCVDVTPEMALAFIRACRKEGVEVVVAPYEADSQLAYLAKENIVDFVITEDSDLLAFGCKQVLFKMNDNGDGKLIEMRDIGRANSSLVGFTPDSFRHTCILCGCDYLPSVPGVGPSKAAKLMRKFGQNPYRVIKALKFETGKVPENYERDFHRADYAFRFQLVFDPRTQQQVRLTPLPPDLDTTLLDFAGVQSSPSKVKGLARGNLNPFTLEVMDTYSPSKAPLPKSSSWDEPGLSSRGNSTSDSRSCSQQKLLPGSIQAVLRPVKVVKTPRLEEDAPSETELQQLYGGGGGGGGTGATQSSGGKGREEEEGLASRAVARPAAAVLNRFAVTTSSQPKQCVRSRFFARVGNAEEGDEEEVREKKVSRSGIAVLAQIERGEGMLVKRDSGIGESIASSPSLEGVANSQEAIQLTSPVELSLTQDLTTAKKRLAFDGLEDCTDGRPTKKKAVCVDGQEDEETPEEGELDLPETNTTTSLSDSDRLDTKFMNSEDFITGRPGPSRTSSSSNGVVDLTSTEETQSPLLRHNHYPLFTPPLSGAGAQVHVPTKNSSGRRKGPRSGLRIGLNKNSRSGFKAPQTVPSGSTLTSYYQYQQRPKMSH